MEEIWRRRGILVEIGQQKRSRVSSAAGQFEIKTS